MGILKKIEENELLKTPVFTVVKKKFENTDFQPVGLNCNDWVSIVAIDDSIENDPVCVVVKQTRWGKEAETIEFPCGTVENGEKPIYAAIREFKEETGIQIEEWNIKYAGQFNPNPAYFNNLMHVFVYRSCHIIEEFLSKGKQHLDKDEDCKVFISRLSNVEQEIRKGGIGRAILESTKTFEKMGEKWI